MSFFQTRCLSKYISFAFKIVAVTVGYVAITYWLNIIRTSAPLWFLWCLIIVQLLLYLAIFVSSYHCAVECGLRKSISMFIFIVLTILGRVNDWEVVIIPLTIIIMVIVSLKARNSY